MFDTCRRARAGRPGRHRVRPGTYLVVPGRRPRADRARLASLGGAVRYYEMAGLASTAKLTVNLMLLSGVAALRSRSPSAFGGLHDDQLRELLGNGGPGLKNRFEALLGPGGGLVDDVLGPRTPAWPSTWRRCGHHLQVARCPPGLPPGG